MSLMDDARDRQQDAVASRVKDHAEPRRQKIALLRENKIASADSPARVAARIDRLSRYYADVRPIDPIAVAEKRGKAFEHAGKILERIINTDDLVDARYLQGGDDAQKAVGRVDIKDENGRVVAYGTGSLVTPRLLLTNHHVLPDEATAAASAIEFDYQDGVDGRPLTPILLGFDPRRFFLTDEKLDFTLVAVAAPPTELARFRCNRLIAAEGKAIVGDFVSIIQHPGGEKKQVALRENRVVDVLAEGFLHYETDTEPGSSGSPVFNDQWEVVALHHASVEAPDRTELGGIVNEGVRVSALVAAIRNHRFSSAERPFVDELLGEAAPAANEQRAAPAPARLGTAGPRPVSVTVPLRISVTPDEKQSFPSAGLEGISIDPDYTDREGYDAMFLGIGAHEVPLPTLPDELVKLAATNTKAVTDPPYLLPYHHFTIALNKERRLAFFTAVNIDGATGYRLQREPDRWSFDPRVPEDEQTGEAVYEHNDLDRGHLVRRLDPAWGQSEAVAKVCNDDTFHFTNCTPQYREFNEYKTLWAGLEDYILENADNLQFRVSVFSGPVLAADDDLYRDVQLPRQFWKVVTMVKDNGELSATAYLLSQADLIRGLEVKPEAFSYGQYRTFQVPLRTVAGLTGLDFGPLPSVDPLEHEEALVLGEPLERHEDIQL